MRIGLLSDTHIPDAGTCLPHQLEAAFSDVDLILHAGDIFDASVLDRLESIAPVLAARGDDDHFEEPDSRVKDRHVLKIEGLNIWLSHDFPFKWWGWVYDSANDSGLAEALRPYGPEAPDVVIFGHSHRAFTRRSASLLLVNPGSPTFPGYRQRLGTIGFLTIAPGTATAELVQLGQD